MEKQEIFSVCDFCPIGGFEYSTQAGTACENCEVLKADLIMKRSQSEKVAIADREASANA